MFAGAHDCNLIHFCKMNGRNATSLHAIAASLGGMEFGVAEDLTPECETHGR